MRMTDRLCLRLRGFLMRSAIGLRLFRFIRWVLPLVAPYTPPKTDIPPERARAFVKVEVRPSTIPGAGQGLFALERIEAGVNIGEYSGDIVNSIFRTFRLRNKDYLMLTADPAVSVDPSGRPEVMMRYVCHHPGQEKRNVEYQIKGTRVFLETTRPVEAGEELLGHYGDDYWRVRGLAPWG